jgi:translation initiation factor 2 beta subunit (eIF-2beta)/eIF-5
MTEESKFTVLLSSDIISDEVKETLRAVQKCIVGQHKLVMIDQPVHGTSGNRYVKMRCSVCGTSFYYKEVGKVSDGLG